MFGCKKICIEERRVLWAVNGPDLARTTRLQMKARKGLNATSGALPLAKEIVRSARAVLTGVALSLLKLPFRWPRREYVIKKWKCKMVSFFSSKCLLLGCFSSGSTKRANRPCTWTLGKIRQSAYDIWLGHVSMRAVSNPVSSSNNVFTRYLCK